MQIRVQVTLVEGDQNELYELGSFEREVLQFETLGLTLEEGKDVLHTLQAVLIEQQVSRQLEGIVHVRSVASSAASKVTIMSCCTRSTAMSRCTVHGGGDARAVHRAAPLAHCPH